MNIQLMDDQIDFSQTLWWIHHQQPTRLSHHFLMNVKHLYLTPHHFHRSIRKFSNLFLHLNGILINYRTNNECINGKKLVHKVEPIFNNDKSRMRIFLEDGSLAEYLIRDLTTAEVRKWLIRIRRHIWKFSRN